MSIYLECKILCSLGLLLIVAARFLRNMWAVEKSSESVKTVLPALHNVVASPLNELH